MSAAQDVESLSAKFGADVVGTKEFRGEHTISVKLGVLHEVLATAKKDFGYEMIIDISSLDFFGEEPRFEMVYELVTVDDSKAREELGYREVVTRPEGYLSLLDQ